MTRAELRRRHLAGSSLHALATAAGCTRNTVASDLRRMGVEVRPRGGANRIPAAELRHRERLVSRLHAAGMSSPVIARRTGISEAAVLRALRRMGYRAHCSVTQDQYLTIVVNEGELQNMARITNGQILTEIRKLDKRMMEQFNCIIREIRRVEDGLPRDDGSTAGQRAGAGTILTSRILTVLACLFLLPTGAVAQDEQGRTLLEAGIVGGNTVACPGYYAAIGHRLVGPVSAYGMIEPYRCVDVPWNSARFGGSLRLGSSAWSVRPALRGGIEYGNVGDVTPTVGGSLTFGQRYGARFVVDRWTVVTGDALVLLQIGGYISF